MHFEDYCLWDKLPYTLYGEKKLYKVGYLYQSVADKTGTPILKIIYLGKNFYNLDIQ